MTYTPNPELERLKKEKEENEKKVEQLDHRIQRLENRIKYYKDADRKKRTHRLCTVAYHFGHYTKPTPHHTTAAQRTKREYLFSY